MLAPALGYGSHAGSGVVGGAKGATVAPGDVLFVKIEEAGKRLFRRMLRLLYMGAASGQAGGGAEGMSVRGPMFNPALMADFGVVKYYNYTCLVHVKLFGTRRRFLQWEVMLLFRHRAFLQWEVMLLF